MAATVPEITTTVPTVRATTATTTAAIVRATTTAPAAATLGVAATIVPARVRQCSSRLTVPTAPCSDAPTIAPRLRRHGVRAEASPWDAGSDGYTNDIVYLRNVPALNYMWTDGALYYGPSGLDVSSFYYSTPGYDLARYNNCYNALVSSYGVPVSVNNAGGSMSATWFGGQGGYITLSFGSGTAGRFLTTLTFGL